MWPYWANQIIAKNYNIRDLTHDRIHGRREQGRTDKKLFFIDVGDEIDYWDVDDCFTIQTATRLFYTK